MARTSPYGSAPAQTKAMRALQAAVDESGIDPFLAELCKLRASQINGCAYCLAMHAFEARELGETEVRLHLVAAWREADCYTPAERAALALTEAVTLLAPDGVPDGVWAEAQAQLGEDGTTAVLWLLVAINAWNRLQVTTQAPRHHWLDATPAVAASNGS